MRVMKEEYCTNVAGGVTWHVGDKKLQHEMSWFGEGKLTSTSRALSSIFFNSRSKLVPTHVRAHMGREERGEGREKRKRRREGESWGGELYMGKEGKWGRGKKKGGERKERARMGKRKFSLLLDGKDQGSTSPMARAAV